MSPPIYMYWLERVRITSMGNGSTKYLSQLKSNSRGEIEIKHTEILDSLWPSDDIWHHRTWSTLVQVMASCLTTQSQCLNQWCLFICDVLWHSTEGNFKEILKISSKFDDYYSSLQPRLPGYSELTLPAPDEPYNKTLHTIQYREPFY